MATKPKKATQRKRAAPTDDAPKIVAAVDEHLDKWRRVIAFRDALRVAREGADTSTPHPPWRSYHDAVQWEKSKALSASADALDAMAEADRVRENKATREAERTFAAAFYTALVMPKTQSREAIDKLIEKYGGMHNHHSPASTVDARRNRRIYLAVQQLAPVITSYRKRQANDPRPDFPTDAYCYLEQDDDPKGITNLGKAALNLWMATAKEPNKSLGEILEEEALALSDWLWPQRESEETVRHAEGNQMATFAVVGAWLAHRHQCGGAALTVRDWYDRGRPVAERG